MCQVKFDCEKARNSSTKQQIVRNDSIRKVTTIVILDNQIDIYCGNCANQK
jgi:hypothetical protein